MRQYVSVKDFNSEIFQSTHPRGVRLVGNIKYSFVHKFQSTHPRGVRLHRGTRSLWTSQFQSTHPRGVRHLIDPIKWSIICISIHAPARGATFYCPFFRYTISISIHAPARGATFIAVKLFNCWRFQSTHPRGVRRSINGKAISNIFISIHAPARGATLQWLGADADGHISIHAPARGATTVGELAERYRDISIHAPARGATARLGRLDRRGTEFQSTHPRGVRHEPLVKHQLWRMISIHAPARGATNQVYRRQRPRRISIHAPARGATLNGGKQ